MQQIENKTYTGKIKTSNGVFGFIESELGETFFHKKGLKSIFYPQKNDEIEFQIEPSIKKQGEIQACEIVLIKKSVDNEISEEVDNRLIGIVKWYDTNKGFGLIGTPEKVDYFLRKDDLYSKFISAGNVVVFYGKNKNGKNVAVKCKHTFGYKDWKLAFSYADKNDIITVEFVKEEKKDWGYGTYRFTETQGISIIKSTLNRLLKEKESLTFNELCFLSLDLLQTKFADEGYKLVKEIVASNKINEQEKNTFLKSAFDKTNAEYQYKLFFDNLVLISEQEQSILLQRYLTFIGNICISNYAKFIEIAHSDKIAKLAKVPFIESAFENTNSEYQYKMLNDGLLILSEEKQIEFLKNYLFELGSISFSNYEKIKNIAKSDRFEKSAKNIFLKSAIENSTAEYHYKMLIEDNLLNIQNETSKLQIELLQKYLTKIIDIDSNWNVYDRNWKYNKIKFIAQSNLIEKNSKDAFLKSAFEKSTAEYHYKMLFEDNLINIQKETPESQIELLSKFERLDLDKIKTISNSDKLDETVKDAFLKSAFEKSTAECQYKLLFEDNLINIQNETPESQINLLSKFERFDLDKIKTISESDKLEKTVKDAFLKSVFENTNSEYQYKMLNDGLLILSEEKQIEFLKNYLFELGSISFSNYEKIKNIAKSDRFEKSAKNIFLKSAIENSTAEYHYKMLFEDNLINIQKETPESQIELLSKFERLDLDKIKTISNSDKLDETVKDAFLKSAFEKSTAECQYKLLFEDNLINIQNETPESQINLLSKFERFDLDKIKTISESDKLEKTVKDAFLKSAFEKSTAECQYKLLFEDNLINIQNETPESQIELLSKFERFDLDKIKTISESDKLEKTVKDAFLKSAFEKSTAECQYKLLFEDNLINIQNETPESQIELLNKFERLDLDKIKIISESDKLEETVKDAFLKSAFKKSTTEIQYKMLFGKSLIKDIYFKLGFLISSTQCGRMTFTKGSYAGETYFEVLERDIEYLHKNKSKSNSDIEKFYTIKHGYWSYSGGEKNQYYLSSKYEQWKEVWISILEDINNEIENKKIFSVDSGIEEFFNLIAQINDVRELFYIFRIEFNENDFKIGIIKSIEQLNFDFIEYVKNYRVLACIKRYNPEFYSSLFEKNYPNILKIDRLYLWLNNLNSYYNYLELVQSAWQLSNDERKLLNKRIKEYAKDERLQKFYNQIPVAEIIEKTESTITYKCKWRNLYYKNGSIQVFFDKSTSSEDYMWDSSREEWNLLTQEYFNNRRIDDIIVTINHNNLITKITGIEDIEVKIVIAEVRKNGTLDRKTNISTSQISKIIHNISARNQCINFLASQDSDFNVLDIQELVTDDYGSLRRDVSFIFPIPDNKGNMYLIWESAEFEKSKATHIFKCSIEELEDMEFKIKDFIESNLRTRSRLNSVEIDDLKVKRELQYFCRVNHDSVEYQVWENRMREVLPFLK